MTVSVSDIISALALLLSGYAIRITYKFNERQKSLIESQEKLNNLLLEKEISETKNDKRADLSASFVKLGSGNYRLKIWNKGKASAKHVRVEFPEGNDIFMESEIADKFPLESLETYQAVELYAAVDLQTKAKHTIKLIWSDDVRENNEKIVYPTL
jgi:hypothetical protein